jgi:hypothetical protein
MLSVVMLSVVLNVIYAECCDAECCAECQLCSLLLMLSVIGYF